MTVRPTERAQWIAAANELPGGEDGDLALVIRATLPRGMRDFLHSLKRLMGSAHDYKLYGSGGAAATGEPPRSLFTMRSVVA